MHGTPRWCLWLVDLDPADPDRSPVLKARINGSKAMRLASKDAGTYALSDTPHLMRPNKSRPEVPYLCIPRHFSEHRRYATAVRFEADVISGDANFTCPDPDGFGFAVISSAMFMTWQRTVGGRIKSDLRFSKDIVWNNFPLPAITETQRRQIIVAGQGVLSARALHPNRSLADHYQPLSMTPELVKAHRALDKVVDKTFGVHGARRLTEADRQRVLFAKYAELAAPTQPVVVVEDL